jgi:hypothetical protein
MEACHLSASVDQAKIAEQSDVKYWLHRDLLDSRIANERTTRFRNPSRNHQLIWFLNRDVCAIHSVHEHTLFFRYVQWSLFIFVDLYDEGYVKDINNFQGMIA